MNLIQEGIAKNLIKFDEEEKYVTYVHQNKRRNYSNPEEQVQLETFLQLILTYNYDTKKIQQFVSVTMGSTVKEADIIVYNDEQFLAPHIVIECKKQEISELEFTQAIEQGFSYAVAEGAKYVWITSGLKNEYYEVPKEKPKQRIAIPDIPQFGVSKLAKYKYAKEGGLVDGQRLFELEIVSEDELTRRFKQAHQSLWGGGELNPSEAFDELDKLIFCKIWDEKKPRKKGSPYDFQVFTENTEQETNYNLSTRIKSLYQEGSKKDSEVFKDDIRLSAEKLRTVVGYLESINLGETDLDSKGRAFETFMGSFFRGDFGQFFTPRNIVKFIVDVLPINHDSLVLDTSCGSGGFLLHALDKIRKQANEYYGQNSIEHYKYWHDFAEKNLFGIEINEQIARTAKMNMIIHDDGHTNVIACDGLLPSEEIIKKTNNYGFAYNRFNFIITNPPFGSVIKDSEQAYMKKYSLAFKGEDWLNPKSKNTIKDNQNTEILFIEQCYNFLAEGGYLAIVLPDGILTNSSLQYVRDWLEEYFRIVAVVSLPQTAFSATGAGVKSSVLFLKKHPQNVTDNIKHQKVSLQDSLKQSHNYLKKLQLIDKEKTPHLKNLRGFDNPQNLTGKELTNSELYKEWKKEVMAEYAEKIDTLKETLNEQYFEAKKQLLTDYNIFMAIAEDIGYDATGKSTNNNELDFISQELARFIEAIELGNDNFFLSNNVDKNKIFLVKLSVLDQRIDVNFYQLKYNKIILKIKKNNYKKLREIVNFSNETWDQKSFFNKTFPYIEIGEIDLRTGEIQNINSINIEDAPSRAKMIVRYNDILISTTRPNRGAITRITIDNQVFIASTGFSIIRGNLKEEINRNYLFYILRQSHSLSQMEQRSSGGNYPAITQYELSNILIPIPPLEIQNEIVAKMDAAYNAKKQKETEAQKLLDSIDNYLLGELGIKLPEPEKNTIEKRIFCRKLSEVSGGRFDPDYFQSYYKNLEKVTTLGKYSSETLAKITTLISNGNTPASNDYVEETTPFPIIKVSSYFGDFISFNKLSYIKYKKTKQAKQHDIYLLSAAHQAQYVGRFLKYLAEQPLENTSYVGELICIRANTDVCHPMYLFSLLNMELYKNLLNREKTGQTSHIYPKDIKNILIPLPPLEKQNEIANYITEIRARAKQLQQEAKQELERAKIEVEKMILG